MLITVLALSFIVRPLTPSGVMPTTVPPCNITEKIGEAKDILKPVAITVGEKEYTYTEARIGKEVSFKDPEKQIALAVINHKTCAIRTIIITKRGDQLLAPKGWNISVSQRANGIRWNNWATDYLVTKPSNWIVIATKYPYVQKDKSITDVLYTAYNHKLNTPSMIRAGTEFPMAVAMRALERLKTLNVRSLAYPDMLVSDVPFLKPDYGARRLPIELIDLSEFLSDPSGTTERMYVLIAANRSAIGSYTCSPAAACGALQWTKGTYTTITKTYSRAKLIPDFTTGARNLDNAMVATILLDDYNLSQFKKSLSTSQYKKLIADPRMLEETLASAYNTGSNRTILVLKEYFAHQERYTDWAQARGTASKAYLLTETKGYIAKLRYITGEWLPVFARQ